MKQRIVMLGGNLEAKKKKQHINGNILYNETYKVASKKCHKVWSYFSAKEASCDDKFDKIVHRHSKYFVYTW